MNILALDLAQTTGFWHHNNGTISTGTREFKRTYFDGGGIIFFWFQQWLETMYAGYGHFDIVAFEAVHRHKGTIAAHSYGGFMATLQAFCESKQVPYEGIDALDIKQFWCGSRGAKKQHMIEECRRRGYDPYDDNEADATALGHLVAHKYNVKLLTTAKAG